MTITWEQRKLDVIFETITDFVAAGSFADMAENVKYYSEPNYAQLVRTTDLKANFKNSDFVYVDKKGFDFLWRVNLDTDCIIMPNIGNCGEIYAISKGKLPYKNNVLGPNAIYLNSKSNFIFYLSNSLKTDDFQNKLKNIISPNGQTKFNKTDLKKLTISLPIFTEQKRIGILFDKLDSLITLHQRKFFNCYMNF